MSESAQKREQPQISVPVDSEMLARVKSAASAEHRSVANYARLALSRALEQQREGAAA